MTKRWILLILPVILGGCASYRPIDWGRVSDAALILGIAGSSLSQSYQPVYHPTQTICTTMYGFTNCTTY